MPIRRSIATSLTALLLAAASSVGACSCGATRTQPAPPPAASGASSSSVAAMSSAPAPSSSASAVGSNGARAHFSLNDVAPVSSHAALAGLQATLDAKDWPAAAKVLTTAIGAGKLTGDDLDRARFALGRVLALAKDKAGAADAYVAVSAKSPLRPFAALRAAVIRHDQGRETESLKLLDELPELPSFAVDRHLALGDALAATGDLAKAADAYGAEKRGPRWHDAAIRYAEVVAKLPSVDDARVLDAASAVRRVRFEAPSSPLAGRAILAEQDVRARASGGTAAASKTPPPPTEAERLAHAIALVDGKPRDAAAELATLIPTLPKGKPDSCRAKLALARAHEKLRDRKAASDDYGDAATSCTDEASHVTALYDGAKIALAAKQPDVAKARFRDLEKAHPKHRLADDARVRRAQIVIDGGDVAGGEALLAAVPDDFADGDMAPEALFRLALSRMKRGEWKAAIPYLEKSLTIAPHEDGYFSAGRAAYFLGRAKIETGNVDDGSERLRKVIAEEPLSFASAMAYARLCSTEAGCAKAKQTLQDALSSEPSAELFSLERPELTNDAFARAVALASVGEHDLARKELAAAGIGKDAKEDEAGLWLTSAILVQTNDARGGHAIPRHRITSWAKHFPAGKWQKAWSLAYPRPWHSLVVEQAAKTSVPEPLIYAVMREESAFEPEVVSPSAAYGLLQLIEPTAAHYAKPLGLPAKPADLIKPDVNIPLGAAYLKKLLAEFPEQPAYAVPSYNAGEGATHRWLNTPLAPSFDLWVESIPFDETRKYTKRVLTSYYAYVALYDAAHLHDVLKSAAGR